MSVTRTTDFEIVEPGFVSVRFHGRLEADETGAVFDCITEAIEGRPFFVLEAFMDDIDGMTPEARRVAAERLRRLPDRAFAIIGGSFAQKIIAKLVMTAVSMLGRSDRNIARFFDDKEAARSWLREYAARRNADAEQKTS